MLGVASLLAQLPASPWPPFVDASVAREAMRLMLPAPEAAPSSPASMTYSVE